MKNKISKRPPGPGLRAVCLPPPLDLLWDWDGEQCLEGGEQGRVC